MSSRVLRKLKKTVPVAGIDKIKDLNLSDEAEEEEEDDPQSSYINKFNIVSRFLLSYRKLF
jgi:hypothetical protein